MKIKRLNPNGIDENEVIAINAFERELAVNWLGYANLELKDPRDPRIRQRELDVVLVTHDRVIIIDLKNWRGRIEVQDGQWVHNRSLRGGSPLTKLTLNGKKLHTLMQNDLAVRDVPQTEAFVVFCHPDVDFSALPAEELARCFKLPDFIGLLNDERQYKMFFRPDRTWATSRPLYDASSAFDDFFRLGKNFDEQKVWFGDAYPLIGEPDFRHPQGVYAEYLLQRADNPDYLAILRLWDFAQLPAEASAPAFRELLAKRELGVITHIRHSDYQLYEEGLLKPEMRDEQVTIRYWELFQRTKTMRRLPTFLAQTSLTASDRLTYARLLLSRVARLHRAGVAHTDISASAVWIERYGNRLMLSAFGAAHYPEIASLANFRQYLAASEVLVPEYKNTSAIPDGVFRRDVFLAAALALNIITGSELETDDGIPVIIERDLDRPEIPVPIRPWFAKALAIEPGNRFRTMQEGFAEFVEAVDRASAELPSRHKLDIYRTDEDPYFKYKFDEVLKNGPAKVWTHIGPLGDKSVVKLWPIGRELTTEQTAAILAFFDRVNIVRTKSPSWAPEIRDFGLADVGLFVVQAFIGGTELLGLAPSADKVRHVAAGLINAVDDLHAAGLVHGDLKPEHVRVTDGQSGARVVLLDLFDHTGGIRPANSAYAPPIENADGETLDRAATAKMIGELCQRVDRSDIGLISALSAAAQRCGDGDWKTLAPLKVELARAGRDDRRRRQICIELAQPALARRQLRSDCGLFHVIVDDRGIRIFGEQEQIRVELGRDKDSVASASLDRTYAAALRWASRSPLKLDSDIFVEGAATSNFQGLEEALRGLGVAVLRRAAETSRSSTGGLTPASESHVVTPGAASEMDVAALWNAVIAVELEQRRKIVASAEPVFDEALGIHTVTYADDEANGGDLDYRPGRIVRVRVDGGVIAELDPLLSRRGTLALRELRRPKAIRPGVQLTLDSIEDAESLRRRSNAVARILGDVAAIPGLIRYIAGDPELRPALVERGRPSKPDLAIYGLNAGQEDAFLHLWRHRPLGILQGPPGTGKTKFIASFVHYAITNAHVKNALVLSQSHAAADAAASSIREVGNALGRPLSMLRFGNSDDVSESLLPIHADSIQSGYREIFSSSREARLLYMGDRLGLPKRYCRRAYALEERIRGLLRPALFPDGRSMDPVSSLNSTPINALLDEFGISDEVPMGSVRVLLHDALLRVERITMVKAAFRFARIMDLAWSWESILKGGARTLESFLARTREVICGTCVGAGKRQLEIDAHTYDLVIIDEAARCGPGELAVAMQSGSWVILVGDHRQLSPFVDREIAVAVGERLGLPDRNVLKESDFERVFGSPYGVQVRRTLTEQYRMVPEIRRIVSSTFYADVEITDGRGAAPSYYRLLPEPFAESLAWYDTTALGADARELEEGTSFSNPMEARVIIHLLRKLQNSAKFWEAAPVDVSIGVICMYAKQREKIRELVEANGFPTEFKNRLKVDTIDGYQGQENDIVLVSLVRNNSVGDVGFVREEERVNVALSRARERLVVVGSADFFSSTRRDSVFKNIVQQFLTHPELGCRIIPAEYRRS